MAGTLEPILSAKRVLPAPLALAGVCAMAGCVAGRYLPMAEAFWGVLAGVAITAGLLMVRREHLGLVGAGAVLVGVASLFALHTRLAAFAVRADDIVTFTGDRPQLASIRGKAITSPTTFCDAPAAGYRPPDKTAFVVEASAISTADGWTRATGLVRVTIREPAPHVRAGDDLELIGTIGRFPRPDNPGQDDRAQAAAMAHTRVWMSVPGADGAVVLGGGARAWYARLYWNLRAATRQHLLSMGEGDDGRLLNALIVGDRHPALRKLNESMMRLGVAHYLSISGTHLSVFLGFVYLLCRLALLPPRRSALAVLAVLGLYMLVAEPSAPLLRSAIMAALVCLGILLDRRANPLNALSAALAILLIVDPLQLFTAGFQLSFGIVAGLILLHRPLRQMLFGRWLRVRGLMVFRGRDRVRRWLYFNAAQWGMNLVVATLAAYLVAAPLAAYHFGVFSPYAPLLSVLLAPLVAVTLVCGYLSMALAWPMPNLSAWVGEVAVASAGWLDGAVEAMARLPAHALELYPLSWAWTLAALAAAVGAVLLHAHRWGRWAGAAALTAVAAWTVWLQMPAAAEGTAELHVLAVGAGQCAVLRTPQGKVYVIDAGTRSGFDVYRQVLEPFMRQRRLAAPSAAFVSHANTDHFNGLNEWARQGRLGRLYVNDVFDAPQADASSQQAALVLLDQCRQGGGTVQCLRAGDRLDLDGQTRLEVLWPGPDNASLNANDSSLVLRITVAGRSVLLPGDIESHALSALSRRPDVLKSDVLILPHHGSWRAELPAFVEAVAPRVAIISSASPLPAPAPAQEFYARLSRRCQCLSTRSHGWVCVRFAGMGLEVQTMR